MQFNLTCVPSKNFTINPRLLLLKMMADRAAALSRAMSRSEAAVYPVPPLGGSSQNVWPGQHFRDRRPGLGSPAATLRAPCCGMFVRTRPASAMVRSRLALDREGLLAARRTIREFSGMIKYLFDSKLD
jgi:hypothetical protein